MRLDIDNIVKTVVNTSGSQDTFARYTAGLVCIAFVGLIFFKADYVVSGLFLSFVLLVIWTVLIARFRDIR